MDMLKDTAPGGWLWVKPIIGRYKVAFAWINVMMSSLSSLFRYSINARSMVINVICSKIDQYREARMACPVISLRRWARLVSLGHSA